jgi:hypothetical protein
MLRLSLAFDWSWILRPCIGDRRCARSFMVFLVFGKSRRAVDCLFPVMEIGF